MNNKLGSYKEMKSAEIAIPRVGIKCYFIIIYILLKKKITV